MKRIFIFVGALFVCGLVWSAEPVSLTGFPNSSYDITQTTVSISSVTVASDLSVSGYRSIYIWNTSASATIYYLIGTSTANIPTVGWPIGPETSEKIETNSQVNYQLLPGVSAFDVRKKIIRK